MLQGLLETAKGSGCTEPFLDLRTAGAGVQVGPDTSLAQLTLVLPAITFSLTS